MALEKLRRGWESTLRPLMARLSVVHPDVFTWAALPAGIAGGLLVYFAGRDAAGAWMLFGGALCIALALILDGIDGPVARATGRVSRWGDFLDHTFDRLLDAVWIVCMAASPAWVGDATLGWAAAWFTMLGSYMGTQAQAVAGSRNYRGLSRADRAIASIAAVVLTSLLTALGIDGYPSCPAPLRHLELNPLTAVVLLSGAGGLYTFLVRFVQARREIAGLDASDPLPPPGDDRPKG